MYIDRTILYSIVELQTQYPVTLLTGCRQTGKTTIAKYFRDNLGYKYVSFDDPELLKFSIAHPKEFLNEYKPPLIIDEVQKNQAIFEYLEHEVNVRKLESENGSAPGLYILTGSQKYVLMRKVTESMCGRIAIVNLSTLSLNEIKNWKNLPFTPNNEVITSVANSSNRYMTKEELNKSILRGFYPELWARESIQTLVFYQNLIDSYLSRDIYEIVNIKDRSKFMRFIEYLALYSGQVLNVSKISKELGVERRTIDSWISILETSDIISLLEPYFETSIPKRLTKMPKLYFNDTGLLCYLLKINTIKELTNSKYYGNIVETYVYNEIKKSYYNHSEPLRMYFYRDSNNNEIDFILFTNLGMTLVECKSGEKYDSSDVKVFSQMDCSNRDIVAKCVLCNTNEPYRVSNNVYAYPIWWI